MFFQCYKKLAHHLIRAGVARGLGTTGLSNWKCQKLAAHKPQPVIVFVIVACLSKKKHFKRSTEDFDWHFVGIVQRT